MKRNKVTAYGGAAGLLASGLVAGGVLASSMTANAATPAATSSTSSPASTSSTSSTGGSSTAAPTNPNPGDLSKPQRSDETLLTGDTAAKVKAAALATYADATIVRLETDSDGVYEAHITTGGQSMIVQVDAAFAVTGTQTMGAHG